MTDNDLKMCSKKLSQQLHESYMYNMHRAISTVH